MTESKRVPREPTPEMVEGAIGIDLVETGWHRGVAILWQQMYDAAPDAPSEAERVLARIVDAYDARSELFTNDEICAGALADIARHYLAGKR